MKSTAVQFSEWSLWVTFGSIPWTVLCADSKSSSNIHSHTGLSSGPFISPANITGTLLYLDRYYVAVSIGLYKVLGGIIVNGHAL